MSSLSLPGPPDVPDCIRVSVTSRAPDAELRRQRLDELPRVVGPQPADARVAAEPGPLPAGEPPGPAHGHGHRLVEAAGAGEVSEQLLVAQGLAGRARDTAGVDEQSPRLGHEAGRDL